MTPQNQRGAEADPKSLDSIIDLTNDIASWLEPYEDSAFHSKLT